VRLLTTVLFMLLQLSFAAPAFAQESVEDVSLIALIANPGDYDGKRVRVHGFLNLEFEGNALYVGKDSFDAAIFDAVWIERPRSLGTAQARALSGRYALVEGTFNAKERGHMGAFAGSLERISRLERWPSRGQFSAMVRGPTPWPLLLVLIGAVALVVVVTYRIALRGQRSA
jgi:hypothetical protein